MIPTPPAMNAASPAKDMADIVQRLQGAPAARMAELTQGGNRLAMNAASQPDMHKSSEETDRAHDEGRHTIASTLPVKHTICGPILSSATPVGQGSATSGEDRELDLYDEIECDLPGLFGRAAREGHAASQRLADEVRAKMKRARAALAAKAEQPNSTEKLLEIIACAYQIAGAHGAPEHILDVLADPESASIEEVEAMLPYVAEQSNSAGVDADTLIKWIEHGCPGVELMSNRRIMSNHIRALAAPVAERAAAPASVPEGYKLVPIKITPEMIERGIEAHYGKRRVAKVGGAGGVSMTVGGTDYSGVHAMRNFWRGALAAAPEVAQPAAQAAAPAGFVWAGGIMSVGSLGVKFPDGSAISADGTVTGPLAAGMAASILRSIRTDSVEGDPE